MKDYLKHCSNLDENEYASLWEDYELEDTWIDKMYDFLFDLRWKFRSFIKKFRRMKAQLSEEDSAYLINNCGVNPKYASLKSDSGNPIFSLDDMKNLVEISSPRKVKYFISGGEWFVEPEEDEKLSEVIEDGGDYPGGNADELIDAIFDFITWYPEYLNEQSWKS